MIVVKDLGDKVNFIDENDVFVGYDMGQQCCEYADYVISEEDKLDLTDPKKIPDERLEGYKFDTEFFEDTGEDHVVFRLTKFNTPRWVKTPPKPLYLHLFNQHNGYYSHGFTAKVKGEIWQEGYL